MKVKFRYLTFKDTGLVQYSDNASASAQDSIHKNYARRKKNHTENCNMVLCTFRLSIIALTINARVASNGVFTAFITISIVTGTLINIYMCHTLTDYIAIYGRSGNFSL